VRDPNQVESAILAAFSHTTDSSLRIQALNAVGTLRADPEAWKTCLDIALRTPKAPDQVRHICLEIVGAAIQRHIRQDAQSLSYIQYQLQSYIQQHYASSDGQVDTPHIQNKITQVLTYLFQFVYLTQWRTFFDDFIAMADLDAEPSRTSAIIFFLRVLGSIHDEIADNLISKDSQIFKEHTVLKDAIRDNDFPKIAQFWDRLLSKWRVVDSNAVEITLRTISRWVSWTEITLIVIPSILQSLFSMASGEEPATPKIREAAIEAFTEIAGKKMVPERKLELIHALRLPEVVSALVESPSLLTARDTPEYDVDFAEAVAKLVNLTTRDLVIILNSNTDPETKQKGDATLSLFVPHLLRFFTDEYDEVCSTVIDGLAELLTFYKKRVADSSATPDPELLRSILRAIIQKMEFDETAAWGGDDEEDEAEFSDLRKKLSVLQQQVAAIDENLFLTTNVKLVTDTFQRVGKQEQVEWRLVELSLHELYLFGDYLTKKREKEKGPAGHGLDAMMSELLNSSKYHLSLALSPSDLSRNFLVSAPCSPAWVHGVLRSLFDLV
jgi:exportin-T